MHLWAQVVSRNITKSAKMHEKKTFAKFAKSDAWLSKRMIAKPENQISTINAVEYRNKINDALKLYKNCYFAQIKNVESINSMG